LPSFDLQWSRKIDANLDSAVGVANEGSGATVAERPAPPQYTGALDNRCGKERRSRDIDVHAREKRLGGQMTPGGTGRKRGQRLVRTKKDFVGRPAQERMRE